MGICRVELWIETISCTLFSAIVTPVCSHINQAVLADDRFSKGAGNPKVCVERSCVLLGQANGKSFTVSCTKSSHLENDLALVQVGRPG